LIYLKMDGMTLEERIERLEAESEIRQLIANYSFDIDDRLIESLRNLFTEDGVLRSRDGVMYAKGPDAIIEQYHGRFDALGPGHHFMHDVRIRFVKGSTIEATGRVSGHAELVRNGKMMVAALRYADRYNKPRTAGNLPNARSHSFITFPSRNIPTSC